MSRRDLEQQIINHQRRLQKLKELQALHGISVDPKIPLEIEDIEAELAELQAELAGLAITPACPYRGLFAFREADAPFFFGREIFTGQLLEAVQRQSLVAVLGASGSGKSSVVFAGLIPHLRQAGHWLIADFRPGHDPFKALATTLLPLYETSLDKTDQMVKSAKLATYLRQGDLSLRDIITNILQTPTPSPQPLTPTPHPPCLLLIADQFEELYSLCSDADTRRRFLDLLIDAVQATRSLPHPPAPPLSFTLLLTLRADFLGQVLTYRPFADALQGADLILGPMTHEELAEAIEKPAQKQNVAFEAGLVERILADVGDEPGNLPLLEFALTELWAQQNRGQLTHAAYEAIGRVAGSLTHYAEEIYTNLNESEQAQARRAFIRMVQPGEGTEDTRRLVTLAELGEADWPLVQKLADARLVVTNRDAAGQETVEVVHEALIQNWGRLRSWLDEDRAALHTHRRLTEAAAEWVQHGRDESYLYRGARLVEAEEFAFARATDLNPLERGFVQASSMAEQVRRLTARRRMQWIIAGLAIAMMILAGLAAIAFKERNSAFDAQATAEARRLEAEAAQFEAEAQKLEAERARVDADTQRLEAEHARTEAELQSRINLSRQLASQAAFYRNRDLERSLLLAIEAVLSTYTQDGYATLEADTVLRRLLGEDYRQYHILLKGEGHSGYVNTALFSSDGTRILTAGGNYEAARLWDADTGEELAVLDDGHIGGVLGAAFSPDGTRIVTTRFKAPAKIWNTESGKVLFELEGHHAMDVSFSPDGSRIVTAGTDGTATIWNAQTGQQLTDLDHRYIVWDAIFSPDGSRVLTTSGDGTIKVWEVASGQELIALEGQHLRPRFSGAVFSPDGTRIVTPSGSDNTVRIWGTTSGEELALLEGHKDRVTSAVFSPDGTRIVTVSADKTARIWDAASGQELIVLEGHGDRVTSAAFSPDGTRIVTGSSDKTARIWDAATGRELAVLEGHSDYIMDVNFSPDGSRVLTYNNVVNDHTVRVWDTKIGKELFVLGSGAVQIAGFSPDGSCLLTARVNNIAQIWDVESGLELAELEKRGQYFLDASFGIETPNHLLNNGSKRCNPYIITGRSEGTVRVWNVRNGQELVKLTAHHTPPRNAILSPDGTRILIVSDTDTAPQLWDTITGKELAVLNVPSGNIQKAIFSPDGSRIITVNSAEKIARIWDTASGQETAVLEGHGDYIISVAFSPGGARVVTGSNDKTARVWEAATGEELAVLEGHDSWISSAIFSPDETRIATASDDKTARIWDVSSGVELLVLEDHNDTVGSVAFSPDGSRIVTASDRIARVWDAEKGNELAILRGHTGDILMAFFSPDGTHILTAADDGDTRIWRAEVEQDRLSLRGHENAVWTAVFNASGTRIATAGEDGTARIWDVSTGTELVQLNGHEGPVYRVRFSPSGEQVATAGNDGTVRLWDVATGKELDVLKGDESVIPAFYFDPSEKVIAAVSISDTVRLQDMMADQELLKLQALSNSELAQLDFDTECNRLITTSISGTILMWDVTTGQELSILKGHSDKLTGFSSNPDCNRSVTSSLDGTARMWDVNSGEELLKVSDQKSKMWVADYSPGGKTVLTAGEDGTARVWDTVSGQILATLRGHDGPVFSASFDPTGDRVVTSGADGTIRLWNVKTGEPLSILPDTIGAALVGWEITKDESGRIKVESKEQLSWVWDVRFSPSGDRVVAASMDGSVAIYLVDTNKLLELAKSRVTRELTCQERVQFLHEKLECIGEAGND